MINDYWRGRMRRIKNKYWVLEILLTSGEKRIGPKFGEKWSAGTNRPLIGMGRDRIGLCNGGRGESDL